MTPFIVDPHSAQVRATYWVARWGVKLQKEVDLFPWADSPPKDGGINSLPTCGLGRRFPAQNLQNGNCFEGFLCHL